MAIRVLLVGRHEALLEGLRARLTCEADFAVHVHAICLDRAWACLRASEIDVIVLDGDCPLDAALVFARQVRSLRPTCGMLLIESTQVGPWREVDCSQLLNGLIGRQDLPQCLPEAVRTIGEKGVYLSPEVRNRAFRTGCGLRYSLPNDAEHPSAPQSTSGPTGVEGGISPWNGDSRGRSHDASLSEGLPPASCDVVRTGFAFRERVARRMEAFHGVGSLSASRLL